MKETLEKNHPPSMFSHEVTESLNQGSEILESALVSPEWSVPRRQCVLLEVYADSNSPLTESVRKLGHFAIPFTKTDGDLATSEGRRKLWEIVDRFQPLNIWVDHGEHGTDLTCTKVSSCLIECARGVRRNSSMSISVPSYAHSRFIEKEDFMRNSPLDRPCHSLISFSRFMTWPRKPNLTCVCLV